MKLEDELLIIQCAQGHQAEVDLQNHFSQLTVRDQQRRLFDLLNMLEQFRLTDADIEQFNALSSTGNTSLPFPVTYSGKAKLGLQINMAESELENYFTVLLNLLKKAYHQSDEREKAAATDWWFQNLSDNERVQNLLIKHEERVNELYTAPGFRSEFTSLARLYHDKMIQRELANQEATSQEEVQTQFDFISYDGIMEKSVTYGFDKTSHAIYILHNAIGRAIARKYGLDSDTSSQLVMEVLGKYYQDSYNGQYDD